MARMKAPIQSVKHIVQSLPASVTGLAIANITLLQAEKDYTGQENRVPVGAIVKAVYIELWILSEGNNSGSVQVSFEKRDGNASALSFVSSQDLDLYANKKNIFYVTQGLTAEGNANPIPFMRGWFKIPRGKQRMGLNDRIMVNISALSTTQQFCGIYIFKHYT